MAYEPSSGNLLLMRNQGGGGGLFRLDATTGAAATVTYSTAGGTVNGIVVEPASQKPYVLLSRERPEADRLAQRCRLFARGLGYEGYASAASTRQGTTPLVGGDTVTFTSPQASGKELVVFDQ